METSATVLIIYNPVAGKGTIGKNIRRIRELFKENGINVLSFATKGQNDAYRAALTFSKKYGTRHEDLNGRDRYFVVSAGGDGTLDEVMRGVLDSKRDVPIGIIPVGSTNDFGYSLGLSGNPMDNARIIIDCIRDNKLFRSDIATLNGKYFTYTASFGLFSDVSYMTPRKMKNMLGHFAYILYGAMRLPRTRKICAGIKYDGNDIRKELLLGMVVSAKSVGGFRNITGKNVRLDDGEHELMMVLWPKNITSLIKTVKQAFDLMKGKRAVEKEVNNVDRDYGIIILKAKNICFDFERKTPFSVDGEEGGEFEKADIEVLNGRIRYICPVNND